MQAVSSFVAALGKDRFFRHIFACFLRRNSCPYNRHNRILAVKVSPIPTAQSSKTLPNRRQ